MRSAGTRPSIAVTVRLAAAAVVAGWVAAAILVPRALPGLDTSQGGLLSLAPSDSASTAELTRSAALFGFPLSSHSVVVQHDPNGMALPPVILESDRSLLPQGVAAALRVANTPRLVPFAREHDTAAVTYLLFSPGVGPRTQSDLAHDYARSALGASGSVVGVTGAIPAHLEEGRVIGDALPLVEAATLLLIAVIVGGYFRSIGAPLVVLTTAGIGYVVAIRVAAAAADRLGTALPRELEPILVVLLLAVVTDYSIFFLSGMRRRLAAGEAPVTATLGTVREYGPTILTAGLTVAAGTATLLVASLEFFRSLGPGLAVTVLLALGVAVTLVPALMVLLGPLLFWPSVRRSPVLEAGSTVSRHPRLSLRRALTRRPIAAAVALICVVGLAYCAVGLRDASLGLTPVTGLPDTSEPQRAASALGEAFVPGALAPTEVLLEGSGVFDPSTLAAVEAAVRRVPGVAGIVGAGDPSVATAAATAFVSRDGDAARMAVVFESDPYGADAIAALRSLRSALPGIIRAAGLRAASFAIGGDTALADETVAATRSDTIRVALVAGAAILAVLVLFLRALIAPVVLLLASSLAVAAPLGLAVTVFQDRLGDAQLTSYVPFAAAVLLVSLGADYNTLLVGAIWEHAQHLPLRDAIATAVPQAARAIAAAGITLAASFALLAIVPLTAFREYAFVMAVGLLLDAFVVRSLLVPAVLTLIGERAHWPTRGGIAARRLTVESGAATSEAASP